MRAWIITWESVSESPKVAAILSARTSPKKVKDYVQFLYNVNYLSFEEQADIAKYNNPERPVYKAEFCRIKGIPWQGQVLCGHHPWLFARLADILEFQNDLPVWNELPKPNFS